MLSVTYRPMRNFFKNLIMSNFIKVEKKCILISWQIFENYSCVPPPIPIFESKQYPQRVTYWQTSNPAEYPPA